MRLKICGITNLEDARFCAGAGADYLGFIQYEKSPRYVEPARAKAIIEWIYGPEPVGVFVNESAEMINRTAAEVGFSLVQLHGEETPEICTAVERPVIKAFRVERGMTASALRRQMEPYLPHVQYVLLDTYVPDAWGGTGMPFNWQVAADLAQEVPLFLAGGLNADNLEEAAHFVQPFAVDLSSSVESAPGTKDFDKLSALFDVFERVRATTATR